MILFLTSQIGATVHKEGKRVAGGLDNRNGFLTLLQDCMQSYRQMLYISGCPQENEKMSDWFHNTVDSLKMEGIRFANSILLNGRNAEATEELIGRSDIIFLSGGHLPTQNRFFQEIKLQNTLRGFEGIIVAQNAGSMNCARTVYACPELPGESNDPDFNRFLPGLGLADINLVPHYNHNQRLVLDGKRFYEDIIYPDSFRVPIHVLPDGSFFLIQNGQVRPFGTIYLFHRGEFQPLSGDVTA